MISQGAHGCIAYACLEENEVLELKKVQIVREYEDVFLEELSGLPSPREIEF